MIEHIGPISETGLFNVSSQQLKTMVETAVGEPIVACSIVGRQTLEGFQGYAAEKILPIVEYRTASGSGGKITLFVKRMYGLEIAESQQYRFLAKHRIPIPRVLGHVIGASTEDIMFFERLDAIGFDESNPKEVREFVGLLARLNAIRPSPEDPWQPPPHVVAREFREGEVIPQALSDAWRHALNGDLGEELLQLCAKQRSRLEELCRASVALGARLDQMPRALLHEDYAGRNTGWHKGADGRRELVVFDVHRLSMGPRFWDLAEVVGSRTEPCFKNIAWEELVAHYLECVRQYGGPRSTIAEYESEVALLRGIQAFTAVPFVLKQALSGNVDWTTDREEGRRSFRRGLFGTLQSLLSFELR